jgi:anti-sigma factor RsiW
MNCDSASELLPELLAGSLDRETELEVLSHLAHCAQCRVELAFWAQVSGAVKADAAEMPNGLLEDVRENLFSDRTKTLIESLRFTGRALGLAGSAFRLALSAVHL